MDHHGSDQRCRALIGLPGDLLGYAHAHATTGDTRMWVADLERMLAIAWDLMMPEQKVQNSLRCIHHGSSAQRTRPWPAEYPTALAPCLDKPALNRGGGRGDGRWATHTR
jgi:hypothetical protein